MVSDREQAITTYTLNSSVRTIVSHNTAPGRRLLYSSGSAMPSATILIVDDYIDNRIVLTRHVEHLGHIGVSVGDGAEALEILQEQAFDLILLDLTLPGMSGYEVLAHLHADPRFCHIPVIIVSAFDNMSSIARCIELGAEDYLVKPVEYLLLHARINACLAKKWARDREQAALAAIEVANRCKNDFISMIVHEFNSPLTTLLGYSELLYNQLMGPLNQSQEDALAAMLGSVTVLRTLTADLADLSRIEAGQLDMAPMPINLAGIVDGLRLAFQTRLEEHQQHFIVAIPANLPYLWGDPIRLTQILTNLLSNASKYTPPGGTIALIAEMLVDRGEDVIHIVVSDTGIGIAPEEHSRIFQPFFRANDDQVQRISGMGLGLNITKRLVQLHGGNIWFESTPGVGSSFHFTCPQSEILEVGLE